MRTLSSVPVVKSHLQPLHWWSTIKETEQWKTRKSVIEERLGAVEKHTALQLNLTSEIIKRAELQGWRKLQRWGNESRRELNTRGLLLNWDNVERNSQSRSMSERVWVDGTLYRQQNFKQPCPTRVKNVKTARHWNSQELTKTMRVSAADKCCRWQQCYKK